MKTTPTNAATLAPVYLGLDLGMKGAHWAATRDGETFEQGTLTLDDFPALIVRLAPVAVGMEYSGRLAEQWCLTAMRHNLPAFILHSVLRKALNHVQRQTAKTDKADAQSIARNLRLWHNENLRRLIGLPPDLFTDAERTRAAWTLRALLADAESLTRIRTAAKLRLLTAERLHMPERAALWEGAARAEQPEAAYAAARAYAEAHFSQELNLLLSIKGVGEKIALSIIGYILPLDRFAEKGPKGDDRTFRNLRRYVGLLPVLKQSGEGLNENHKPAQRGQRRLRSILTLGARGAADTRRTDRFARQYQNLIAKGVLPRRAINRVATAILRVAVAVLRTGRPCDDTTARTPLPELPPAHLIAQSEAAKRLNWSRQRVHQWIERGAIQVEEWQGKRYVIAAALENLPARLPAAPKDESLHGNRRSPENGVTL